MICGILLFYQTRFARATPFVNRADVLKPVLTVVYPEYRSTHSPDASTTTTAPAGVGTDEAIEAIDATGDLLCWIDYANTRVLDASFQQSTGAGFTSAWYIYNRSQNSMLTWVVGYGSGMTIANFPAAGTGTVGMTRTGSWESVLDSTPIAADKVVENFEYHALFMVPNNTWSYIIDLYSMRILWWDQALTYYDANGTKIAVPGITIVPMQDYLLSVKRIKVDQANTNFEWRVENLTQDTVQTATTGSGLPLSANPPIWRMGHASGNFNHVSSAFFVCNSDPQDTDRSEQLQSWLRNAYNGGSSTAVAGSSTANNQWYQLYDSKRTTYHIQPTDFGDMVETIELEFEDHKGNRFDPKDCVIEMHAK
jgi:hypothetical protein